ncbi:unnamed protein product [Rhodiola kirilowii]
MSHFQAANADNSKTRSLVVKKLVGAQAVEREEETFLDARCSHEASGSASIPEQSVRNGSRVPAVHGEDKTKAAEIVKDYQDGQCSIKKQQKLGVAASHAVRCANNFDKQHNIDSQKQVMLGKKRSRQTMFLDLEDVKQAVQLNPATPRRPNCQPLIGVSGKISRPASPASENAGQPVLHNQEYDDVCVAESTSSESHGFGGEGKGDIDTGISSSTRGLRSAISSHKAKAPPLRHNPWLLSKVFPPKKPTTAITLQYQDTSIERLIREVTSWKLWHQSAEIQLQCVPDQFESVDEYIRVFEPLLFEECRAQLFSTWEELAETNNKDAFATVKIKNIERRERGWFDVVVLPTIESKWSFKEGDIAVLSNLRPGSERSNWHITPSLENSKIKDFKGRVVGTIRRHNPIDTRDPTGATLHFYVGNSIDSRGELDNDHILKKLQPKDIWYLSVLGPLATTQREYVALHAFRNLHAQMQTAILQPSPKHFPRYEEHPPGMPECFTPNFVDHLRKNFNEPQLAAIQWAAMHTAAGTTNGLTKKRDPWPFTLVQGPPGTGKTHTVWGMLNVIHLVQYQHYYAALLKKLAPDSYKQPSANSFSTSNVGSLDEVLQRMDQNLFRSLPKLCPKPRMLVCAPSNAATDELLSRVLDRGFIDGEMKVYRPDVARVGVDTLTRAAQAVSVERRTEQLLCKSRDEVYGWMQQLRNHEAHQSQQIAILQRELNVAAATCGSQGSVGVDPDVLLARDQRRDALLQSLAAAVEARDKVLVEMSRFHMLEGKFITGSRFNFEEARASLEASFANEAEIVFTTVSSSGRKLFSRLAHGFDMVVIDEAAQASEVAILPPLSLGATRCVLVGDPQQLPATVISKAAGSLLYNRSLFERFQQGGCPTMLLSVQYRMHPQIRDFPSKYFYKGRLIDSESVTNVPDEKYYQDRLLRPYIFYDIAHGRESHRGGSVSYENLHEAQFCLQLYEHLQKTLKRMGLNKVSVGIITPYKLQLKCIRREFDHIVNSEEGKDLYINTVDAFQGQERDVIIMSCVRASDHGVGFVADIRRMNVALTRARRALWVLGNANALIKCDDWAALIADAKARNCYLRMDSIPKEFLLSNETPNPPSSSSIRGSRSGSKPGHRYSENYNETRSGRQPRRDEVLSYVPPPAHSGYRSSYNPSGRN